MLGLGLFRRGCQLCRKCLATVAEMAVAPVICGSCGTELRPIAKFCDQCGTPNWTSRRPWTRSGCATSCPTELLRRSTDVVRRYGGIVDKFTGDGVMALFGAIALGANALRDTAEALRISERSGNDFTVGFARFTRGLALIHRDGADSDRGFALLAAVRELSAQERLSMTMLPAIDTYLACAKAHTGDLHAAIELSRGAVDGVRPTI